MTTALEATKTEPAAAPDARQRLKDKTWAEPALDRKLLLRTRIALLRIGVESERVAAVTLWLVLTVAIGGGAGLAGFLLAVV